LGKSCSGSKRGPGQTVCLFAGWDDGVFGEGGQMIGYLNFFFTVLFYTFVLTIPIWIYVVSKRSISRLPKRAILAGMSIVSTAATAFTFVRPHPSDLPILIIETTLRIGYLLIVIIILFASWPK
jgi:hypothetical protein